MGVDAFAQAPTITSALSTGVAPGAAFSYTISGTDSPTSYGATGLPSGLTVNTSNGLISGTVASPVIASVTISAANASGTGNATLSLIVGSTQTITFTIGNQTLANRVFSLGGTASSGLAVSYAILSGPAMVSGSTITLTGEGTVSIRATQAGGTKSGTIYQPAANVDRTFSVTKASQTITFPNPGTRDLGDVFDLTATASSGLAVSYTYLSGPAILSGSTVAINGAGTVSIRASQAGDSSYTAASDVTVNFTTGTGTSVADTLLSTTSFSYTTDTTQSYTVPAQTDYVIIKAWGAGGGSVRMNGVNQSTGGQGAFTKATYEALPGEQFTLYVARGGGGQNLTGTYQMVPTPGGWPGGGDGQSQTGGGGGHTLVITARGSAWAGGGGGGGAAGTQTNHGGNAGAQGGAAAGGNNGGGGATAQTGGAAGSPESAYAGFPGGFAHGGSGGILPYALGGGYYAGAGGGSGYYGGGSGGNPASGGWGGGGGGSSLATDAVLSATYQVLGSGDSNYPGGTIAQGGSSGSNGGNGAVVILAYKYNSPAAPAIVSALTAAAKPGVPTSYWIRASRHPTSYAASNLPPGLTVNTTTGEISGTPTTAGSYNSTISATNLTGTTPVTLAWKIDDTAPSVPTGLAAQSGSIAPTSFVLTWSAATDAMTAVSTYEVQRNGVSVGITGGTALTINSLLPGTQYAMTVRACDAVGNWSNWSSATNITTVADTSAPSVPGAVTIMNRTATTIELEWAASADDIGVTAYEVRQNGTTSLGTTTATSLLVGPLTAGTAYSYQVRARDAAGNWSAWTTSLNVSTASAGTDTLLQRRVFSFNGQVSQAYTVPAGTNYVVIKAWGAGGGGSQSSYFPKLGAGGNGGFATATYSVIPGDSLAVSVGTGGRRSGAAGGNAGSVNFFTQIGGGGGGYSSVQTPYGTLWAAGGGGASSVYNSSTGEGYGGGGGGGTTAVNTGGLTGAYYNGASEYQTYLWSRIDPRVTFDWGHPDSSGVLWVRWTGQVQPRYSETYRFGTTTLTGGAKLWVNGQLLFEAAPTPNTPAPVLVDNSGTIALTAGQRYDVTLEFRRPPSTDGGIKFWWQSPSQATEIIPSSRLYPTSGSASTAVVAGSGTNGSGWHPSGSGAGGGATTTQGGAGGNDGTAGTLGQGGGPNITQGNGGGGGGYYGGGAGRGGGGGSSFVSGSAYNVRYLAAGAMPGGATDVDYPGNVTGIGGYLGDAGENGGHGTVVIYAYQTPGTNLTQTYVPTGGNQTFTVPAGADYVIVKAWGAGGGGTGSSGAGGGYVTATYNVTASQTITINAGAGGAAAAAGGSTVVNLPNSTTITAAGGGSGVSSSINVGSQSPTSSQIIGPTGATPASTSDANYPGGNVGYGGAPGGAGGNGGVVLVVHIVPPTITSSLTQNIVQHALVNYTVTASNGPSSINVTGLPAGLSFNPATSVISGTITAPGTYNSTVSATNRGGTTQSTLTWNVAADTTAPSIPTGLQAQSVLFNAFTLTWTASTDNVGATAYEVSRDGVSQGVFGSTGAAITGLLPVTTYEMRVRARDAAGNWSAWSSIQNVQTVNVPPSAPVGATTFAYSASPQYYTVPSGAGRVEVKAWGGGGAAGGSYGSYTNGGAGAYVGAMFTVTSGQTITIYTGAGAGGSTFVNVASNAYVYAAGGGNGGEYGNGGPGGAPNGVAGTNVYGNSSGSGGSIGGSGGSTYGIGGAGGPGNAMHQPMRWVEGEGEEEGHWEPDGDPVNVGGGSAGGTTTAGNSPAMGGDPGALGDAGSANLEGGRGGHGFAGGGGGGSGDSNQGGGGGGGGASAIVGTLAPLSSAMLAGSGATAPNTSDPSYPGNYVGYGGNGFVTGHGAVVIIAYAPAPTITSSASPSYVQHQPIEYTITTSPTATWFTASGLPSGLSLNPTTGVITGSVSTVGSYTSTLTAANTDGQGAPKTVVWGITADSAAPSTPSGLQASNASANSFVLTWTASTDNARVTSYEVKRDGVTLGASDVLSYTVIGATTGVTYAYSVRARDPVGNWSAWSTALNVTLTSGTFTSLNYAERTATTVTLMWAPMAGSAAYKVYRNGTLIATVTDTAYADTGLSASTSYNYTVTPVDTAGNNLPGSISMSVTTTGDFSADTDHDGVPDSVETLLTTSTTTAGTIDTANSLQVKIQRPPQ